MLYDTHCHPYLAKIKDKNNIIKAFREQNPTGFLNSIWTNLETSKEAITEAKKYDFVKASIWIHPCDIDELDIEKTIETLEKLYLENRDYIVAIWECGLDYYRLKSENDENIAKLEWINREKAIKIKKDLQRVFFIAQIKLAEKYNLPVIIHNRESRDDIFEILKETNFKNFIFHCYSENLEFAKKLLDFSPHCMISFSGIVTFKSALDIQQTAQNIPLQNILIETDSPYLTPVPYRWKDENEPNYTKYVLEKIIELRDEEKEGIEKQIWENSLRVFKIKK